MAREDGVEIYKRFYPWPERFRLGDPVLVQQVTGLTWPEFVQACGDQDQAIMEAAEAGEEPPTPDQVVLAGLIAIAFWQGNPEMSREKARRALERIPMEDIDVVEGDDVEDDAGPPDVAAAGAQSPPTTNASDGSPEASAATETPPASTSDGTTQNGSGSPGSPAPIPGSAPA